jgi:hypothetical protein
MTMAMMKYSSEGGQEKMTELNDRSGKLRTVELTSREVALLLKYGHPFSAEEQKLRNSKAVGGYHHLSIDVYWIEMMLADLSRSARKIRSRRLLKELDGLCSVLECALSSSGLVQVR